ncbi:MAG: hypothetical protein J2P37_10760 [Ktedonobacteraceae bacterium]|nr:hypothetical protein [Ktedonobacteraceae bacterium]
MVKWFRRHPYTYSMVLVVALATLLRLLLILFNWPITNSDEGNMGIVGLHVAFGGEWPIFFYGLPYMGPVEGYLAAPLFKLFGPSLITLRLPLLAMYTGFLIGMYYLVRLLYNEKYALASIILLSLGTPEMVLRQIKAVGEYPEMGIGAALIPLLAAWLAITAQAQMPEQIGKIWSKRTLVFGLLGLIIGVSIWVDFLILAFVATAGVLLLIFCRREKYGWGALILGGIIGIFPLIYYNLTAPFSQNSLFVLIGLHNGGAGEMTQKGLTILHQVIGTIMIALPLQTGAFPRPATDSSWPIFGTPDAGSTVNAIYFAAWGIGFLVLFVIACVMIIPKVVRQWRYAATDEQKRIVFARDCARCMLLVSGGLTLLQYITSSQAAVYPITSARYLTCLVNIIPVILWPLWVSAGRLKQAVGGPQRIRSIANCGILSIIVTVYLLGTVATVASVPQAKQNYQQRVRLIDHLLSSGATRIYSEYWTCNNLTFQSQEKIICSSLSETLGPGFDRYAPYRDIVRSVPQPTYVFPENMPQVSLLEQQLKGKPYRQYNFEGYEIFQPTGP